MFLHAKQGNIVIVRDKCKDLRHKIIIFSYCSQCQREGYSLPKNPNNKQNQKSPTTDWQFYVLKDVLSTVVFILTKQLHISLTYTNYV